MPLNTFFQINMPYGIAKNDKGEWWAFNRENAPLGFNQRISVDINTTTDYPVHTAYKALNDVTLLKLAHNIGDEGGIRRDNDGNIKTVYFYRDENCPYLVDTAEAWASYFDKIKRLAKFQVKR